MDEHRPDTAFGFTGTWREYAPIAFTNLLLTIVTLGIYRFWAKARTRTYLWSHTRFIDDPLEWAGTGLELFKGAATVIAVLIVPYFLIGMLNQYLILHKQLAAVAAVSLAMFGGLYYLIGIARFRALRYRLARTYWRGIRGGSDDEGFDYGWQYLWRQAVGTFALGLLIPWSLVTLWNRRWSAMSFGPYEFAAEARVEGLMGRFLLCYLAPFAGLFAAMAVFIPFGALGAFARGGGSAISISIVIGGILAVIAFYFVFGLVLMGFYAKYFRHVVAGTRLDGLDFAFSARTMDWIKLLAGDALLLVLTLGLGIVFLDYRHWSFFIRHMDARGTIDVDAMTQSETPAPRQGEGLLDALDLGAF
ncbi:YjgN family protein [Parablastomonas sp. CN1-191]|uniref:YjgN family protein n=1 Tax=Parablastomonas sp. CN1-191 TaxID=3400908 RepID=UPI003BF814C4